MFNGIIFNKGTVKKIIKRPKGINIFIRSNIKLSKKDIGVSVACDGVCLTLITIKSNIMEFYLSNETIERSRAGTHLNHSVEVVVGPCRYGAFMFGCISRVLHRSLLI